MARSTTHLGPVTIVIDIEDIELMTMDGQTASIEGAQKKITIVVDLPSGGYWEGDPEDLAYELVKLRDIPSYRDHLHIDGAVMRKFINPPRDGEKAQSKPDDSPPPAPHREGKPDLSKLKGRKDE